jgi:uncharacterized membrane protein YdjX (TVP38/TMEM64 family)
VKQHWGKILLVVVLVSAIILAKYYLGDYLTVENVKHHRQHLLVYIAAHYFEASVLFVLLFIATGICLPGALALTFAGGMIFGTVHTAIYANIGATAGATLAFIIARSTMGHWFQERFKKQLARFNEEMSRHGKNYLLTLRIVPIAPFFVINYCAGLTKIPLKTFVWTTSVGIIPGSLIHAFVGHQLRYVNSKSDLLSWKIILALLLPPLFTLLPVAIHHLQARKKQSPK